MPPVVVTRSLTRRYGARPGIEDVSLEVGEGALFGFLGPNGAGKTTTIRCLLGFLQPSAGEARVLGLDCWRQSAEIKRSVGYVPGDLRLYGWMNAREGLELMSRLHGRDVKDSGMALAERLQLDPELRVRKMSRGTRQKVGLVLALAPRPRLLVLDEPTSALDPLVQDELLRCLREMAGDGHTVFFSSHTLSEVEQLCDRVAIVRDGRIVEDARLADLRARARRTVRLTFKSAEEAAQDAPDFLGEVIRSGRVWDAEFGGQAAVLLAWAATRALDDIAIGPPDLERIFRTYYQRQP